MDQVRSELALANAQELINVSVDRNMMHIQYIAFLLMDKNMQKINEKCYLKCVPKPSSSLDSGEQACLSKCMDRYMEAWNVISKAYVARLQRESGGSGGI